jgi:hypothetical protein
MKTIKEIKIEEDELLKRLKEADSGKRKRIQNRLEALKTCRFYLERDPREDFLRDELKRINNQIRIIDERFPVWSAEKTGGGMELRRKYETMMEKGKLRAQSNTLTYLLT